MSTLQAIAYVSSATQLMAPPELEQLLEDARDFNLKVGVTGVLLYSDGNFMQYFEGSEDAVRETYGRIRTSKRHKGIIEVLNERIAQRSFADWQMGFAQPTQSELLAISTANWQRMESQVGGAQAPSIGLTLLRTFWKRSRKEL
jgi:hypothetical protein